MDASVFGSATQVATACWSHQTLCSFKRVGYTRLVATCKYMPYIIASYFWGVWHLKSGSYVNGVYRRFLIVNWFLILDVISVSENQVYSYVVAWDWGPLLDFQTSIPVQSYRENIIRLYLPQSSCNYTCVTCGHVIYKTFQTLISKNLWRKFLKLHGEKFLVQRL